MLKKILRQKSCKCTFAIFRNVAQWLCQECHVQMSQQKISLPSCLHMNIWLENVIAKVLGKCFMLNIL